MSSFEKKCAEMSVFCVKIVKLFGWLEAAPPSLHQNLGAPLITTAIFCFLQTKEVFFKLKMSRIAIQLIFPSYQNILVVLWPS